MRKLLIIILSLMITLVLYGCTKPNNSILKGFYQSEKTTDGYVIQISIQPEENGFVQYIDNREVDSGTYDELDDKEYNLNGKNKTVKITLDKDDSFEVLIKKLNGGNPIKMKNIDKVPTYFSTKFDDVEKYQKLLEE